MSKYITPLELIEETVSYYSEDTSRRGLDETNQCVYKTDQGQMCAVGRCLKEDVNVNSFNYDSDVDNLFKEYDFPNIIKPEYSKITQELWGSLQMLHDQQHNWEVNSLSVIGKERVAMLKKKYT